MITNIAIFLSTFLTYTTINWFAKTNESFSKMIVPKTFRGGHFKPYETISTALGTVHAFTIGLLNLLNLLGLVDNQIIYYSYYFSYGYFLGDIIFICMICKTKKDFLNQIGFIIHHIIAISGQSIELILYKNTEMAGIIRNYTARMYLAEISVVPMNICAIFRQNDENYKENYYFICMFEAFFRTFFVFRILNYSNLTYIFFEDSTFVVESTLLLFLTILNYVWFFKICQLKIKLDNVAIDYLNKKVE